MSLKAKLEAVIYAAEEPVTLAQLTALFAEEALEWKAEQEAAAKAAQANAETAATATEGGALPLLNEAFSYLELRPESAGETSVARADVGTGFPAETTAAGVAAAGLVAAGRDSGAERAEAIGEGGEAGGEASGKAGAAPSEGSGEATVEESDEPSAGDETDAEAEAKRAAKVHERETRGVIRQLLDELILEYDAGGRGIEIREVAGGFRMATKPEFHEVVRSFVKGLKPPLKLSLPALETLAVIAYKQPVTAPEVNEIRGVDSSAVFGSLLARKLIATAGRKPVVGRPILYKTTREFLVRFGLKDVSELPSMEEFEKIASELEEPAAVAGAETGAEAEEFSPDMSVEAEEAAHGASESEAGDENESRAGTSREPDAQTKNAAAETESASGGVE
jgi:segregation and condensation protein B